MFSPRQSISGFMPSLLSSPLPPPYDGRRGRSRLAEKDMQPSEDDGNLSDNEDSSVSRESNSQAQPSVGLAQAQVPRTSGARDSHDQRYRGRSRSTSVAGNVRGRHEPYERDVRGYDRDRDSDARDSYHSSRYHSSRLHSPSPMRRPRSPHTPRTHLMTPSRTPSPHHYASSRSSPRNYSSGDGALIYPPSPKQSSGFSAKSTLTSFFLSWVYRYVVPYLPEELQAIARDPPDLSRPETLVTLFRAVAPYTQFLLVLVVLYVVWAVVSGFIGYMSRFIRFCFRIGPVIAIIAWIMAASGQGGIDVLFEALKQYAGLAEPRQDYPRGAPPRRTPGWETPGSDYYGGYESGNRNRNRRRSDSSDYYQRNRNARNPPQQDPFAAFDGLGATVQGFVRQAVARAAGLDWLLGNNLPDQEAEKERQRNERERQRRQERRY